MINVADLVEEKSGKTYRQLNNEKTHKFPLGALVEYRPEEGYKNGFRAFVVKQSRDCDGTPGYYFSLDPTDTVQHTRNMINVGWTGLFTFEDSIMLIELPLDAMAKEALKDEYENTKALALNHPLDAIKKVRAATNFDLLQAKTLVDVWKRDDPQNPA